MFGISEAQKKEILKYLAKRPYIEVAGLVAMIATLEPIKKEKSKEENVKTNQTKLICPACMGNGYRKIYKDQSSNLKVVIDCEACDNQGEVENDTKNINALRYLSSL